MPKKRFKILTEFKTSMPLGKVEVIKFIFPHENGRTLEKTTVNILDFQTGVIEVELSDFDIQGLRVGLDQNIIAELLTYDEKLTVLFSKALNVAMVGERKEWI
jgi:hypothetical protein